MPKSKKKTTEAEIAAQDLHGRQAEDLFPDLFPKATPPPQLQPEDVKPAVSPPPPPEHWEDNDDPDSRGDDDGHYALVLVRDAEQQRLIEKALGKMGYVMVVASTAMRGIEELRRAPYQLVLCGMDTTFARFRDHLARSTPQRRRRLIYYVLLGPRLRTCYNMEALAMSANLVVNEQDLPSLDAILRKGFLAYERLFGPLLEELEDREGASRR